MIAVGLNKASFLVVVGIFSLSVIIISNVFAQDLVSVVAGTDVLARPLSCGWRTSFDPAHPEKPRQIRQASDISTCKVLQKRLVLIHVSDIVQLVSEEDGARIELAAKALEEGSSGQTIRCRSSMDGAIFLGRVIDSTTLSLVRNERKTSW
jgi:hypothetical protein